MFGQDTKSEKVAETEMQGTSSWAQKRFCAGPGFTDEGKKGHSLEDQTARGCPRGSLERPRVSISSSRKRVEGPGRGFLTGHSALLPLSVNGSKDIARLLEP